MLNGSDARAVAQRRVSRCLGRGSARGADRRVGRATHEAEEGELMDAAHVLRTASQRLGEADGDHARAQSVSERLPGDEVRSERHRGEQLAEAERAWRRESACA